MNEKITLVTAFFPIQRENWEGFERDDSKYFKYFEFWARIQNDLIIYTTPEYANKALEIRKKFGRNNTKVIEIKDIEKLDEELFNSIYKASKHELSKLFHVNCNFPESWNHYYNYVMMLKEWCIYDAIKKDLVSNAIAWIDFGFNHGGEYYINENDFDCLLESNFSKDKIHVFTVNELDFLPIFETVRRMDTFIQGNFFIANKDLWGKLWKIMRENMMALNKVGLIDDDQTILLMAYYQEPELFELHKTDRWFEQLSLCAGDHKFEISEINKKKFLNLRKIKRKILNNIKMKKYCHKWYKILKNEEMKG